MDKHICGTCGSEYSSIEAFIAHKRSDCKVVPRKVVFGLQMSSPAGFKAESSQGQSGQHPRVTSTAILETSSEPQEELSMSGAEPDDTRKKKRSRNAKADTDSKLASQGNIQGGKRKPKHYVKHYKCEFESCNFVTAHQKDLHRHRRIHTGEKPFACQFCEKRFARDDKRKIHERSHTKEKPFACELCSYRCADGGGLKKHLRIHSGDRPYKCQLCPYASRTSSQLVVHLRRHTGDVPFHCQDCDAKFKTSCDLKRHVRIHTGTKQFACDQCSYRTKFKCNLKSHIRTNHGGNMKHKCDRCEFQCRTRKQMESHHRSEHTVSSSTDPSISLGDVVASQNKYSRKVFSCDHCAFSAKHQNTLSRHSKKMHPEKEQTSEFQNTITPNKVTLLKSLSKKETVGFKKKSTNVVIPMLAGKRPWSCEDCNASFVREDSYRSHRKQHEQRQEKLNDIAQSNLQMNTPKTSTKEVDNSSRVISNPDNTVRIALENSCHPEVICSGSELVVGRAIKDLSRTDASQPSDLDHQSVECTVIGIDAFTITETPPTGAEVCIPGDASLTDHNVQLDPMCTLNILSETSEPQDTNSPGELVTVISTSGIARLPTEPTTNGLPSGDIVEGQMHHEETIQTQTLGYGTSNIPVLLSSVSHTPNIATPVVLSDRPSHQPIVDPLNISQKMSNCMESSSVAISQPSDVSYTSLSNVGIGEANSVPVFSSNQSRSAPQAPALRTVQQIIIKQPQQQVFVRDQHGFRSMSVAANSSVTINASGLKVPLSLGMSIPSSGTQKPGQSPMQTASIPTGTFILNGRELSHASPANEETSKMTILPKVP